jgi:hypothetical protein
MESVNPIFIENSFLMMIYLIVLFGVFGLLGFIADQIEKMDDKRVVSDFFDYKLSRRP